ncbi:MULTISPECIES: GNAT family N-acetyltransferase [unclassified Enterococcus]|uniref:GNAT family N-acetyltransferase n=1 Tax=unclassified Enterococcus TaxID=2608891 RepID=UPI001CE140E4|nr:MULTISPECIES: GNAT family N-acetyltransferase [unclassified Enterococcus]MCA5011454.1 GNAT family N-acetyltransferase [Enterococcus sp. S23]MCA5015104.1 GNAT family N-acetyltransferase [Enterococcus sp. S22(2020)]
MLKKRTANNSNHHLIIEMWERSVKATHHFLSEEDVAFYKKIIPESLASVDLSLWVDEECVVGFSGIDEDELVMLFLDPDFIGKGYGSKIITHLINNDGIKRIDVNTQNEQAKAFYLHHGFTIESEDERDGFGKPYPITHLIKK